MKIAILSRGPGNYSTQRLYEAAYDRRHRPIIMDYAECYMQIEPGQPGIYYNSRRIDDLAAVIPRIAHSFMDYGSSVVRQFELEDVYATASARAIVRSHDKLHSLQLLAQAGVPIPKTIFASQSRDVSSLIRQVGGPPLIVKLVESTHGQGVVLATTDKTAQSVIQAFYSIDADILIQEYIEEANGSDLRAFVVGGRVVGAMQRQGVEDAFRSNLHLGGTGKRVKLSPAEQHAAEKAAGELGLDVAGVDLLKSNRGPLVIEVNSSPSLEGIEAATNKDIAGLIIQHIEKNAKNKQAQPQF